MGNESFCTLGARHCVRHFPTLLYLILVTTLNDRYCLTQPHVRRLKEKLTYLVGTVSHSTDVCLPAGKQQSGISNPGLAYCKSHAFLSSHCFLFKLFVTRMK